MKVSFVARGEHLRVIQERGLVLDMEEEGEVVCRPALATDNFDELPELDLCLVCVKEFDLPGALSRLERCVGHNTIVLPLLNGVDVASRVRKLITKGVVLPACVYVGTHIERPGRVVQRGGACRILFGPDPARPDFSPEELLQVLKAANIRTEWTPHIQTEIWKKFIFIFAYGLVTAATGKTVGEVLEDEQLTKNVENLMSEAAAVAKRSEVELPVEIVTASLAKARSFPHATRTSFQRDFERADRKDERDLFAGTVIRMAEGAAFDAPNTRKFARILEDRKPMRGRG